MNFNYCALYPLLIYLSPLPDYPRCCENSGLDEPSPSPSLKIFLSSLASFLNFYMYLFSLISKFEPRE